MKWALMCHNMICSRHYWIWVVWNFFLSHLPGPQAIERDGSERGFIIRRRGWGHRSWSRHQVHCTPSELFRFPTGKIRKYRFLRWYLSATKASLSVTPLRVWDQSVDPQKSCATYVPPWRSGVNLPPSVFFCLNEEEDGPDDVNGDEDSRRTMVVDAINFVIDNNVESWNTRTQTAPGEAGERWSLNRDQVIHLWKKSNTRGGCFKMKKMNYVAKADMCYQKTTCELAITLMVVEGEPND